MKRPTNTYHHFLKTSYFLILLVLFSCGGKKVMVQEQVDLKSNPKLVFLSYSVQKTDPNGKHISLIDKTVTDGKLKNNSPKFTTRPLIGDLKCSQLDKNLLELNTVYIKNPLIKVTEFLNDSLSFSRQKIEQKNAPLSLKLQLHPNAKYVSLSHVIDSSVNTRELIKTEL